ncbi:hypothetical protein BV505_08515 [Thermomonas haemolytica]|nr:hypothetical protein BV505_08515 [Thermomonas haemolytica]
MANELLNLLSVSDEFRELFVSNTKAALEIAGYIHSDERLPHPAICFGSLAGTLASKSEISAARDKLLRNITQIQGMLCPFESQSSLIG